MGSSWEMTQHLGSLCRLCVSLTLIADADFASCSRFSFHPDMVLWLVRWIWHKGWNHRAVPVESAWALQTT